MYMRSIGSLGRTRLASLPRLEVPLGRHRSEKARSAGKSRPFAVRLGDGSFGRDRARTQAVEGVGHKKVRFPCDEGSKRALKMLEPAERVPSTALAGRGFCERFPLAGAGRKPVNSHGEELGSVRLLTCSQL